MTLVDITSLEAQAKAVVQQSADKKAAIADERGQRAALLAIVLATVKAALPDLGSRIQISNLHHNDGSRNDKAAYHTRRGLRVDGCGNKAGPVYDDGDRGGAIEGWDVYLLDDGSVLELYYAGTWSAYDRDTDSWEVEQERLVPAEDAAEFLVAEDHDHATIDAIKTALTQQLNGKAQSRIKAARERADKIRAIITLLS